LTKALFESRRVNGDNAEKRKKRDGISAVRSKSNSIIFIKMKIYLTDYLSDGKI